MNDEYDVVVLGTGLTECVLSGVLSVSKKKVLHLDRNDYYGAECASLNLQQMYKKFKGVENPPEDLGKSRDWNIDLVPKFLMANGKLVKILRKTGVTKYNMVFTVIDGSFVVKKKDIHKVPSTVTEVMGSPLMSLFEKFRVKKLLSWVAGYDQTKPKSWQGIDASKQPMRDVYKKFGIGEESIDFLGHAVALYTNDDYIERPAIETIERMNLYNESLAVLQASGSKSPYVYPQYGLGELPQVFARLCAVYGGTYMLNKPVAKIHYDENGHVCGVESEGEIAKCKQVVGDPSYFPDKVKKIGQVIRCICILDHPIPNTKNSKSCQIIIPQKQLNRKNDLYISMTSSTHCVCGKGFYVAFISTTVETSNPSQEIEPAIKLLGAVKDRFEYVSDLLVPANDPQKDGVFVTNSYDPTAHFASCAQNVLDIYEKMTGTIYDLTITSEPKEGENVDQEDQGEDDPNAESPAEEEMPEELKKLQEEEAKMLAAEAEKEATA